MNKNIWIGICLLLLGMCSCNSKWDDYFSENSEMGEETVVSNLNLLDYKPGKLFRFCNTSGGNGL